MSRQESLEYLLSKLHDKEIYDIREELEGFLQEAYDSATKTLQEAISDKLDGYPFPYFCFDDFLSDFMKNNPTDPAAYSDFRSRIYGE